MDVYPKHLWRKTWVLLATLVLLLFVTGCAQGTAVSYHNCNVVIESGEDYFVFGNVASVPQGEDITFQILLSGNRRILAVDYPDYSIEPAPVASIGETNYELLTLYNVRYSTVVSLTTYCPCRIYYYANGGQRLDGGTATVPLIRSGNSGHLRQNTEHGTSLFKRTGYTLVGWNTAADGSGDAVGLGSRVDFAETINLYAQWSRWTEESAFQWSLREGEVTVTRYSGSNPVITVPAELGGYPVTGIAEGAFQQANCQTVILPESITGIKEYAFVDAAVEELYFYDTLLDVSDVCFTGCDKLTTIHINASRPPVYSGTYFSTFPDKMDWLMGMQDDKKIVLFSGSSARFGYDSPRLDETFPSYQIANMGVYAYSNTLPQYLLILSYMNEGDILLSAPEFDAIPEQFCCSNQPGYEFFAMIESNYDLLSELNYQIFSGLLDSFQVYQSVRKGMTDQGYEISAKNFDEDHNPVTGIETYNKYGDYIYPRPNQKQDRAFGIKLADYEVDSYPEEVVQSLNHVFQKFLEQGITVWFSYAPRSLRAVTTGSTEAERERLHVYLQKVLCVPVISEIEDSMYSGIYFYETDNHLSDEGVKIRTERVIEDIYAQMKQEGLTP